MQIRARFAAFARSAVAPALIPPVMIMFAMRDHPEVYRLDPASANWEWIALLVFAAEFGSVALVAGMLRLTIGSTAARPSLDAAGALAARTVTPLWASAVVLAIPSLAALIAVQLLAHAVALRTLYRGIRRDLDVAGELEALHVAYMVYSVPVVLWVPLLLMIFVSLSPA